MSLLILLITLASSVLTLSAFLFPPVRRFIFSSVGRFWGMRYRISWRLDEINSRVRKASEEVFILQTWVPTLNRDIGEWRNLKRNLHFRILLMDGSFAPARTKVRPPCTPLGPQNIDLVRKFNDRSDVKIELRHYDVLPFGPVYIVDDTIYWGIYIANDDSMTGPQFVCSRRSPVGKMIEASLNAIWDSASPDNLEASLQPNAAIRAEE